MTETYEIGISLALQDGVSAGIDLIRRDLAALDRAIANTAANLARLSSAEATASSGAPLPALPRAAPNPPASTAVDPQPSAKTSATSGAAKLDPQPPRGSPPPSPADLTVQLVPRAAPAVAAPAAAAPATRAPEPQAAPRAAIPAVGAPMPSSLAPASAPFAPWTAVKPVTGVAAPVAGQARARAVATSILPQSTLPKSQAIIAGLPLRQALPAVTVKPSMARAIAAPPAHVAIPVPDASTPRHAHHGRALARHGGHPHHPASLASTVARAAPQGPANPAPNGRMLQGPFPNAQQSFAPPPQSQHPMTLQGDVILDGARMGRWMTSTLARQAARPPVGPTGPDPRQTPLWSGQAQGF